MRQKLYEVTIGVFLENGKVTRDKYTFSEEIQEQLKKGKIKFKSKTGKLKNVNEKGGWFEHSNDIRNEVFEKFDDKLAPRTPVKIKEKVTKKKKVENQKKKVTKKVVKKTRKK